MCSHLLSGHTVAPFLPLPPRVWVALDPARQLVAKHTSLTYCQDLRKAVATTATPSNGCDVSTTRGPTTQTTPSTVIFLSIDMGKLCSEIFQ